MERVLALLGGAASPWSTGVRLVASGLALYGAYRVLSFARWRARVAGSAPGPKSCSWWLGDGALLMEAGGFNLKLFSTLHERCGPVARLLLGPTILNYSIAQVDLISEAYRLLPDRPSETKFFLFYLYPSSPNDVIVMSNRETNKKLRGVIGSAVYPAEAVERMVSVAFRRFAEASAKWGGPSGAEAFELKPRLQETIYDVMGEVFFNRPWRGTADGQAVFEKHNFLIKYSMKWSFSVLLPAPAQRLFRWLSPGYDGYVRTISDWHKLLLDVVDKREADIATGQFADADDFLTVVLKNGSLSRNEKLGMFAGSLNGSYDTTVATAFWLLFHLARYPAVQDKLLAELDAQPFSKQDRIPTVHETRAMDYCGALLLESMRCKPTVPVNQRVNFQEDVVIGGVTVEKGTNVNIAAAVAFKDPKVFPDPERFNPERFLGESDAARAQVRALQAFGAHSRICIGMIMVKEELKAMLAALLRHHRVQLKDPNQSYESDIEAGVNMPPPDKEVQFFLLKR